MGLTVHSLLLGGGVGPRSNMPRSIVSKKNAFIFSNRFKSNQSSNALFPKFTAILQFFVQKCGNITSPVENLTSLNATPRNRSFFQYEISEA